MTTLTCRIPLAAKAAPRLRRRHRVGTPGVRRLMYTHEAVLGRRTFAIARRLAESQYWPVDRLDALRLSKLRRLFDHARTHCPYFADCGLPPGAALRTLDDLRAVPLITRDQLRRHASRLSWRNMPRKKMPDRTRGTTDQPLTYYWDRARQAWDKANRLRGRSWQGLDLADRELHLWPFDPPVNLAGRVKQWLRDRRDKLFADLQIDSLHAFHDSLPLTWRTWRRFDPVCVTAYPSALAELIQQGRKVGCPMGSPSLQRICLTGEVTFPWQRELIERHLGVAVSQDYGIQEVGALAFTCEHGRWHFSAESAVIEILRHGRPARNGELGELVVTGLEGRAMPIVRYCTGDIVRVKKLTCACGRTLPVMPPVLGRAADFLETDSGEWIEPAAVLTSLGEVLEDGRFRVVQSADGGIQVTVVTRQRVSDQVRCDVVDRIRHLIGPKTDCRVNSDQALRRTIYGKCRYVHSDRTRRGLATA